MSRIDELIHALCPNGVSFAPLSDLAVTVPGLTGKTKTDFSDGNARFASYRNIFANPSLNLESPDFVKVAQGERQNSVREGDILITGSSESLDDVGMSSVVMVAPSEPIYLNSFCFILRLNESQLLLPAFSKHLFRSELIRKQIRGAASGVTRINISKPRFMKIRIPVPPLEVQREIARVLDQFTQLEAELEAELEARRRQYGHYKDVLLTFSEETQWGSVGDVCRVFGGAPFKSDYFNNLGDGLPVVRIRDINSGFSGTFYSGPFDEKYLVHNGDVLIGMDGDFKTVRWAHGDAVLNQRVSRLQDFDDENDPSFIFHLVRDAIKRIQDATQASTVKHLSTKQIAGIRIPLLPLDEQRQRSAVLDNFDALVNDLSIGLPAELAVRRKQYEYYRDKLLSFEEAAA